MPRGFFTSPPDHGLESILSYNSLEEELTNAISAVQERIAVSPSSRVARLVKAIRRLSSKDGREVLEAIVAGVKPSSWFHPYRDAFLALGEARMFIEVVEQLLPHLADYELKELVTGHEDPALDRPDVHGRNKQFEWFVAAIFRRAGVPVALAEPDVLIQIMPGVIRSVAAKRISSRKRVHENIRGASSQIARAGYPGYIFLDISRYIDPDLAYVEHWRTAGHAVEIRMDAFARRPEVVNRRNALVSGVLLRSAYPLISPGFTFGTSERWYAAGVGGGSRDEHMRVLGTVLSGAQGI